MKQDTSYKYIYAIKNRQVYNIVLGIGMIGFAVFLFFYFNTDTTRIVLITVISVLGIIPLLISLHYYIVSREVEITIHTDKDLVEISRRGEYFTFTIDDIKSVEIHEHKGLGLYEFDFDYAKYNLKDGKFFVATSYMTGEYYIPKGIEPKLTKEFFSIIWRGTNI
ncbi:hypothetical protein I2I11_21145 [Pontibacter sp. 172403-2]|uniref:hypothetical protein n=1 Tax=Pontibacter rufus TaxID=2791028 RepID=UPI0018AF593F|nr:hypothetical protein [Pontibacter sp. 172403-2]MBF9255819.1 hypothetical protein [Pontibacter sp. 172403-2]